MNPLRCALEVLAGLISVKDVTSLDDILYHCKSHSKVCFFFLLVSTCHGRTVFSFESMINSTLAKAGLPEECLLIWLSQLVSC